MTDAASALIALGSNFESFLGPPAEAVASAMDMLGILGRVDGRSRLYRSPAWPPGGPDYVNAALRVEAALGPEEILGRLHEIEAAFGRTREARWKARTLDLDLLAWGDEVRPDVATQAAWRTLRPDRQEWEAPDRLILPHPRMQDRAFVLAPLAEIAPEWRHPLIGRSVAEMLAALPPEALEGIVPL